MSALCIVLSNIILVAALVCGLFRDANIKEGDIRLALAWNTVTIKLCEVCMSLIGVAVIFWLMGL